MRIKCEQKALAEALGAASKAVAARPAFPVLGSVWVRTGEGKILLTGSDLSTWIEAECEAEIEKEGEVLLPGRLFGQVVKVLPDKPLTLALEGEGKEVRVYWEGGECRLAVMQDDFPALPEPGQGEYCAQVVVDAEQWSDAIKRVAFAASDERTEQVLAGIHCRAVEGRLELAATDGHRLAVFRLETEVTPDFRPATFPAQAGLDLAALCKKGQAKLVFTTAWLRLELPGYRAVVRLLGGNYPNYEQVIPQAFATEVSLERAGLIAALERVGVVASNASHKIGIDCSEGQIRLTATAPDCGAGEEVLPALVSGPSLGLYLNYKYLLPALRLMAGSQQVKVSLNHPKAPTIWQPVGGDPFRYLVMPMIA